MRNAILILLALSAGCQPVDPDPDVLDCSDGLPASTFHGDVGEADAATFCDGVCARDVDGSVVLDDTSLEDLDGLWCLTAVSGDLYIRSNAELTSISGLSELKRVGGNLSLGEAFCGPDGYGAFPCENFGNPALASLDGLEKLETIGGWLWIADNDALVEAGSFGALTSVGGAHPNAQDGLLVNGNANLVRPPDFPMLTTITGQIEITANDSLLSLDGLDALTTHAGWYDEFFLHTGFLGILANPKLESIEALQNLETIGGDVFIGGDRLTSWEGLHHVTTIGGYIDVWGTPLTDLSAFRSLTSVGGWLNLIDNDQLTDFEGLDSLDTVAADLNIMDNDNLVSLHGLEAMTTIGGSLQIMGLSQEGNPALTDVTALYGLASVGENVTITGNTALGDDAARALADEIGSIDGEVTISGNE